MKNSFGKNIQVTLFGESHGEMIGVVIDGLAPGIALDLDHIRKRMEQRKAKGRISTQRHEADEFHIVSGWFEGRTTGTPLTILIANTNTRSQDYEQTRYRLRPSHADYTAYEKYLGYQDFRGGGHFSGRITAPLVAAGAIAQQILESKGILIGSHMLKCHHVQDEPFAQDEAQLCAQIRTLNDLDFPVLDEEKAKAMHTVITAAAESKDSVGGILETAICGFPAGIGEPFFDSIESVLSHLLFSVPAVKGVQFGLGFGFAELYGSEANDAFCNRGGIRTLTNHNGGINGGISNGMPILIQSVIKPTASIFKTQQTVDYLSGQETELQIHGRHDPAIIHRARVVIDSVCALGLLDLYCERQGTLSMRNEPWKTKMEE